MRSHIEEVQLPDSNHRLFIEMDEIGGQSDVASKQPFQLGKALDTIRDLVKGMQPLLAELAPKKATIEFGMQIGIESGALVAIVAKGTASANFKITLGWE